MKAEPECHTRQALGSPVIDDEQLNTRELVDQSRALTVEARQRQILEETGHPDIENGIIEAGRLPSDGAGKPSLPVPVCPVRIKCSWSQNHVRP